MDLCHSQNNISKQYAVFFKDLTLQVPYLLKLTIIKKYEI